MKTYVLVENGVVIETVPPMQYDVDSPEGVEPSFLNGDEPMYRDSVHVRASYVRYHATFIDQLVTAR